jgi:hypothetical protein
MPGSYRTIAAAKWASLGVFPVVNRLQQSERVCKSFVPLCLDDEQTVTVTGLKMVSESCTK